MTLHGLGQSIINGLTADPFLGVGHDAVVPDELKAPELLAIGQCWAVGGLLMIIKYINNCGPNSVAALNKLAR